MKFVIFYMNPDTGKMFAESRAEKGEVHTVLTSHHNFAGRGDLIAQIVESDNPQEAERFVINGYQYHEIVPYYSFKHASNVYFDEANKCYLAAQYGFAVMDKVIGIHIVTPIQIAKDKTKAFYYIHPTNAGRIPDYKEIEEVIKNHKIVNPVNEKTVDEEIRKIDASVPQITRIKIAQSELEPVNGRPEYYSLLIDARKKAGKLTESGSIDYHEQSSIIQIHQGEEILQKFPEIKSVDGTDIFGNKIPAVFNNISGYQRGDNLAPSSNNPDIFLSTIDGCLEINNKTVSVRSVLTIKGDVNFESGNIDFKGSVIISGYVHPDFSVKATGDITIEDSVEDARIESGGNIIVKMGILGKGLTVVKAKGSVKARYIMNSNVEAFGEITVEDSILNSKVFSNKSVKVTGQHATVMGGETTALYRIEAGTFGAPAGTKTVLSVGRNLELELELDGIRTEMHKKKSELDAIVSKISVSFGAGIFSHPREFIAKLPDFKKKLCLEYLSEESSVNKILHELTARVEEIEKRLVLEEEPFIIARNLIHSGCMLNIKKSKLNIEKDLPNIKFYESPEEKAIRSMPVS